MYFVAPFTQAQQYLRAAKISIGIYISSLTDFKYGAIIIIFLNYIQGKVRRRKLSSK